MKKFLYASALCFGLAATQAGAQTVPFYVTNNGMIGGNGFPVTGNGYISLIGSGTLGTSAPTTLASNLNAPTGIAFAPNGNLIVGTATYTAPALTSGLISVNPTNGAVSAFSTNGGGTGFGPQGVVIGPNNAVYNVNGYPNNVTTLAVTPVGSTTSQIVRSFPDGSGTGQVLSGIVYNPTFDANNFYLTVDNTIQRVSLDGSAATTLVTNPGNSPLVPALNAPTDLKFGPDGALYVANSGGNNILKISNPTLTLSVASLYASNPGAGLLLNVPVGLAFDPSGNGQLIVASDSGYVVRITPDNPLLTTGTVDTTNFVFEGADAHPAFIAFSPVPEPSTYAMLGTAGMVLGLALRRHRQRQSSLV